MSLDWTGELKPMPQREWSHLRYAPEGERRWTLIAIKADRAELEREAAEMAVFATQKIEATSNERDEKLREYWMGYRAGIKDLFPDAAAELIKLDRIRAELTRDGAVSGGAGRKFADGLREALRLCDDVGEQNTDECVRRIRAAIDACGKGEG
jgi:hypothetical protein